MRCMVRHDLRGTMHRPRNGKAAAMMGRSRGAYSLDPRLAARLRQLRRDSGLTAAQAAGQLGWSPSKISRVERGIGGIHADDAAKLAAVYGAGDDTVAALADLAERAAEPGRGVNGSPRTRTEAVYRAEAAEALCWGPSVIPPPLRTAGYAVAAAAAGQPVTMALPSQVEQAAAVARAWQGRLAARRDPLRLAAVIDATALRRAAGSRAVMRDQISYLAALAARPNVTIRVTGLDAACPPGIGGFTWLRFAEADGTALPDVAFADDEAGPRVLADEAGVYRCWLAFSCLDRAAEDPGRALDAAAAHWDGPAKGPRR